MDKLIFCNNWQGVCVPAVFDGNCYKIKSADYRAAEALLGSSIVLAYPVDQPVFVAGIGQIN